MSRRHRLLCFAILESLSPVQVGSGEPDSRFSDKPVLRDAAGDVFLPGSTLAGAFSRGLDDYDKTQWMASHPSRKPKGADRKEPPVPPSSIFDDAYPIPDQQEALARPVEIRQLVTLDRGSLTAKPDHLISMEVVPAGTQFRFTCRGDFEDLSERDRFKARLRSFLRGPHALGGKSNSGLGRCRARRIYWCRLDLSIPADLVIWLTAGHGFGWDGTQACLETAFAERVQVENLPEDPPASPWTMTLRVRVSQGEEEGYFGLHMSAGAAGLPRKGRHEASHADAPDRTQASRKVWDAKEREYTEEKIDYGTAVRGRLRTAMEMLLRTYLHHQLGWDQETLIGVVPRDPAPSQRLADGSAFAREVADFFGHKDCKSPWRVEEAPWWDHGKPATEDHIQLCEVTQQTVQGAKFQYEPLKAGWTRVVVSLSPGARDWQKALVVFAGRLLEQNILPWGGFGSRGYLGAYLEMESYTEDFPMNALVERLDELKKELAS